MLLDPFTIIAQLINFAILVVALKFLLYDRVIATMDEREAKIAARIADAEEREEEAKRALEGNRAQRRQFEDQRDELMDTARHDAEEHGRERLSELRDEIDEQRRQWQRSLRREQSDLEVNFKRRSAEQVLGVARRAVEDLAGADLEHRTVDRALDRLAGDEDATRTIAGDGTDEIVVVTGFPADAYRRQVSERLRALGVAQDQPVRFEHDPALVLGVEIRANSSAVSWNAADYLDRLRDLLTLDSDPDPDADESAPDHDLANTI